MEKKKKQLAIITITFLLLIFAGTFIAAFLDTTESQLFFKTGIVASLFFPVMIYIVLLLSKHSRIDDGISSDSEEDNKEFTE